MFLKKQFSFLFLLLLVFLLPACGKKGDGPVPGEGLPYAGGEEPNGSPEGITSPAEPSDPASETQGSQPVTSSDPLAAEDMLEQGQEVGRKGGEMFPVEPINPAEYANFEKECQDADLLGETVEYALDGNILYVKSFDFGDPLIYCLD